MLKRLSVFVFVLSSAVPVAACVTRVRFDTGFEALFKCRDDDSRALEREGMLRDVRHTAGYSGNLGWTNCAVVGTTMHAVVPEFELADCTLRGMPLGVTHGNTNSVTVPIKILK